MSEAVSLLLLFKWKKNAFRWIHFIFLLKISFHPGISYVPELLPSSVTEPWCALMLHHSCLVSHSYPPKLKRAGENAKAALLSLPQQLSIQCLLMTWTWHPGWFMFVTTKAVKQIGWGHEKLKMVLRGVFRNVHIFHSEHQLLCWASLHIQKEIKRKHVKRSGTLVQCVSVPLMQRLYLRGWKKGPWWLKRVLCKSKGDLNLGFKTSSSLWDIWTNLSTNLTN